MSEDKIVNVGTPGHMDHDAINERLKKVAERFNGLKTKGVIVICSGVGGKSLYAQRRWLRKIIQEYQLDPEPATAPDLTSLGYDTYQAEKKPKKPEYDQYNWFRQFEKRGKRK